MFIFHTYKGWPMIFFNGISFILAVSHSYLVNRAWTFAQEEEKIVKKIQFFLFFLVILVIFNWFFLKNQYFFFILVTTFLILIFYLIFNLGKKNFLEKRIRNISSQYIKFVFFTLLGMAINTSIVFYLTTFQKPLFHLSLELWANFSKGIATLITLFWNFFSYKLIVFKK